MKIEFGFPLIAAFRLLQLPYFENIFSNWLNTDTDFEILKKINIFFHFPVWFNWDQNPENSKEVELLFFKLNIH